MNRQRYHCAVEPKDSIEVYETSDEITNSPCILIKYIDLEGRPICVFMSQEAVVRLTSQLAQFSLKHLIAPQE